MIQQHLFGQPQTELTSDDYYTPKWIFDALDLRFELDVASPPGGPPYVPCDRYFTQEDDGLAQEWQGRVWMNPPFSKASNWVERFILHSNGIALLPAARSAWFNKLWNDQNARCFCLPSNFAFVGGTIAYTCMIWAYGDVNQRALSNLGMSR
jgi:phage N-6-adenine-methyltransferase